MLTIFSNLGLVATPIGDFPYQWKEFHGGEIAVRNGRFVAVPWGEKATLEMGEDCVVHDCNEALILPGFVDCHTHLIYAGNRSEEFVRRCAGETYRDIAKSGGGIKHTVSQTREADEDTLLHNLKRRLDRAMKNGTTTIEIKASYGLQKETDLKQLRVIKKAQTDFQGVIVPTCLSAHEIPQEYTNQREKFIQLICEDIFPSVKELALSKRVDVYCEENVFSITESRKILSSAKDLGFDLTIHCDQWINLGGAKLAAELGVLSADHLEQTDDSGLTELAKAGIVGTILPGSIWFANAKHYPNAQKMIDLGVNVAVASDHNPGSSMLLEMPLVLTHAAIGCNLVGKDAIIASTIAASAALNLQNDIGSIEIGKRADFTLWDISHFNEIAYQCGGVSPTNIIVNGKILST